jgi:hypothetical protein
MTAQTAPQWARTLIELLDEQRAIYDAESLLGLLGRRQSLIDRLVQINARIEPFKQQWPDLWNELDDEHRESVRQRIDEVRGLLDHIIDQDERDRVALASHRNSVSRQLDHLNRGAAVHRAYGPAPGGATHNRFTDEQG